MSNRRFAKVLALAGLLVAVALSSGCGFFCRNDFDCLQQCCQDSRCVDLCLAPPKTRVDDAAQPNEFTDLLIAFFPEAQWPKF